MVFLERRSSTQWGWRWMWLMFAAIGFIFGNALEEETPATVAKCEDPCAVQRSEMLRQVVLLEMASMQNQLRSLERKKTLLQGLLEQFQADDVEEVRRALDNGTGMRGPPACLHAVPEHQLQEQRRQPTEQPGPTHNKQRQKSRFPHRHHSDPNGQQPWELCLHLEHSWFFTQTPPPLPVRTPKGPPFARQHENEETFLDVWSFRSNLAPFGRNRRPSKRPQAHPAMDSRDDSTQYIVTLLNRRRLRLFHVKTKQLAWEHELFVKEDDAVVSDVAFISERHTFAVIVNSRGETTVFAVRLFKDGKIFAGSLRRTQPDSWYGCWKGTQAIIEQNQVLNPRVKSALKPWTFAPNDLLHVEFNLLFVTSAVYPTGKKLPGRSTEDSSAFQVVVVPYQLSFFVVRLNVRTRDVSVFDEAGYLRGTIQIPPYDSHGAAQPDISPGSNRPHMALLLHGMVAIAWSNRISIIDVLHHRLLPINCVGSTHPITSLQRDSWRSAVLYAGTSNGVVLVFHLHRLLALRQVLVNRMNSDRTVGDGGLFADYGRVDDDYEDPRCELVQHFSVKQPPQTPDVNRSSAHTTDHQVTQIQTLPGFVLFGSPTSIFLFDSTSLKKLSELHLSDPITNDALSHPMTMQLRGMFTTESLDSTYVLVTVQSHAKTFQVDCFSSLLPDKMHFIELSWMRLPLMLVFGLGFLAWQKYSSRRGREHDLSFGLCRQ